MIDLTKKRLAIRFTLVVLGFTVLILTIIALYFHQSLMFGVKRHMSEEIQHEFVDQFHRTGLDVFKAVWDEFHFQIINANGDIVVASRRAQSFYPVLNTELMGSAFSGNQVFETVRIAGEPYLVAYFPLSEKYIGRVAASLHREFEYERDFFKIVLLTLPGILLVSFLVSWYLVKHAMKPIADVFTFQENFSSTVSHELRSPLASLKGNLEVSMRKDRSPQDYREIIALSLTEVDRIISLLNDLSLIASSKFKPLDLYREKVDIKTIITELVNTYTSRTRERAIRIENGVRSSLVCICDGGLMKRVFDNIINNAVRYTPPGGTIAIAAHEHAGKKLVNISNTCKGIKSDEVEYFFEPFYRGKEGERANYDGKGLGLFIARHIVRSHGGDIIAKLTDDREFSLTVSLPR